METMKDIKARFASAKEGEYNALFRHYENDERSGVQKLIQQYHKKLQALEDERVRTESMKKYEHEYEHLGYLCGIDEVGRGPLAGPVVACAVILPKDCDILWLNDSKKLTAKKREELYDVILEGAVSVGIGMASPERIDEINILQATYEAMRQAIAQLNPQPQVLLNDAVRIFIRLEDGFESVFLVEVEVDIAFVVILPELLHQPCFAYLSCAAHNHRLAILAGLPFYKLLNRVTLQVNHSLLRG